ncbi:hypothetical protein C8R44DRAFT_739345 [Mycena epipterygia]|nr:hypothetical protein C8R44DRAFT_739345 [Mycena epipterygia]
MPLLTVHLKPRPSHPTFGTAWIPHGLFYGPFTPSHGPFPLDATERHDVECSDALVREWAEFDQIIRPRFEIPSFDSAPLPDLYAVRQARMAAQEQQIHGFLHIVIRNMLTRYRDLPIAKRRNEPALSGPELCHKIMAMDFHSMDDTFMEFKIWVSMTEHITRYIVAEIQHGKELDRRCSWWDKLVGAGTYYTRTSPKCLAQTPLILSPGTTSSEPISPLELMGAQNLSPSSSSSGSEESELRSPKTPSPEIPPDSKGVSSNFFPGLVQRRTLRRLSG